MASGRIQSSGIGATSDEMYVVTPSRRLEGIAARASQYRRRRQAIASRGTSAVDVV